MKRFLICLAFFGTLLNGQAQSYQTFQQNGKFGFKKNNVEIISAKFDNVSHFTHHLALVQSGGKWGYIDSLGNWVIPAQFDRAQPFIFDNALVELNNKVGYIDTLGKYIVEAKYSNIVEDYNGFHLHDGELRGYLEKENHTLIPAIYKKIDFYYGVNVGHLPNGKYDIYSDNILILGNLEEPITNEDINYYFKTVRIKQNEKYGLLHFTNGWITKQNYAKIEEIQVPDYNIAGYEYSFSRIYALHSIDLNNFNGDEPPMDSISFIRPDGSIISPIVFDRFEPYYSEYMDLVPFDILKAWSKGKIYTMDHQLRITETRYNSMQNHLDWYIAEDGHKYYVLNKYKFPIDSFERILVHSQMFNYYDENNDQLEYDEQAVNEPYLIFQKGSGEGSLQAIYDLNLRKIISPWIAGKLTIYTQNTEFGARGYTYGNEEKMGFFVQGMLLGTEMIYSQKSSLDYFYSGQNSFYFTCFNQVSQRAELFESQSNTVTKLGNFEEVIYSNTVLKDTVYYDPEIYEPSTVSIQVFKKNFILLKENGKFGLVSLNGKVFPPVYDTLIENDNPSMLLTYQNGLYGSIDLESGNELKPFSKEYLIFRSDYFDEGNQDNYLRIEIDSLPMVGEQLNAYYLNSNGKKFYCHYSDVNIKKTGRKYGLSGYSDLPQFEQNEIQVTDPIFKMMETTYVSYAYKAKNIEKKWGLINFYGDTIAPFIYDKITSAEMDLNSGETYLKTRIKKKVGLISIQHRYVIPAIYDEIKIFESEYENYMVFLVKLNNKFGLINLKGVEILPCEYDQIKVEQIGDNLEVMFSGFVDGTYTPRRFSNQYEIKYSSAPKAYDFLSNGKAYRVNGAYLEEFDIESGLIEQKQELAKANLTGVEYNITMRNGKFGASDKEGKELIAPEYDFAEFFIGRDEVMIGYQKGVKYYIYVFTKERYTEQQW